MVQKDQHLILAAMLATILEREDNEDQPETEKTYWPFMRKKNMSETELSEIRLLTRKKTM